MNKMVLEQQVRNKFNFYTKQTEDCNSFSDLQNMVIRSSDKKEHSSKIWSMDFVDPKMFDRYKLK